MDVIIFYLVAYRKKIVLENLRNSFPEKEENEIRELARKFYRQGKSVLLVGIQIFFLFLAPTRSRNWQK